MRILPLDNSSYIINNVVFYFICGDLIALKVESTVYLMNQILYISHHTTNVFMEQREHNM